MKYHYFPQFGIDHLALAERDTPQPGPGQVLVRMRAWSLNFRDLGIASGSYARGLVDDLVPLSDGAGEVVETGDGVDRWSVGDRVTGIFMPRWQSGPPTPRKISAALGGSAQGVLAEYVVFDEDAIVAAPAHLSFEEAATLPCAGSTAWHALHFQGRLLPGETVLTLGSGGVSLFALQFAAAAGARVIATSSSDGKLDRQKQLGAFAGINYMTTPEWGTVAFELAGAGVDHVIDMGAGTLPQSMAAARIGGRINLIGVLAAGPGVDTIPAVIKALHLQGMMVGSREVADSMSRAVEAMGIHPVIDRVFGFTEAVAAYRHAESRTAFGKVVITADT